MTGMLDRFKSITDQIDSLDGRLTTLESGKFMQKLYGIIDNFHKNEEKTFSKLKEHDKGIISLEEKVLNVKSS